MNSPKKELLRGEAWMAQFPATENPNIPVRRPVVIIQNNTGNYHAGKVIVVILTSHIKKENQPTHVVIESGVSMGLMVLAEEIHTLEKWRLYQYIGTIDPVVMDQIDQAVCSSLGLTPPDRVRQCLCGRCLQNFMSVPGKRPKRVNRYQTEMFECDYCHMRPGYDYWL